MHYDKVHGYQENNEAEINTEKIILEPNFIYIIIYMFVYTCGGCQ